MELKSEVSSFTLTVLPSVKLPYTYNLLAKVYYGFRTLGLRFDGGGSFGIRGDWAKFLVCPAIDLAGIGARVVSHDACNAVLSWWLFALFASLAHYTARVVDFG